MTKKSQPTNRSRTPSSEKFMEFVGSNWGEFDALELTRWPVADFTKARRETIASEFPGKVLIFEASEPRVRSNDSDYRYRPDSAFVYFTGWGSQSVPGSALVIDARGQVPESTLYLRPTAGKDSDEFLRTPQLVNSGLVNAQAWVKLSFNSASKLATSRSSKLMPSPGKRFWIKTAKT